MRCLACDTLLTDAELRNKDLNTGEFTDLCSQCRRSSYHAASELQGADPEILEAYNEAAGLEAFDE